MWGTHLLRTSMAPSITYDTHCKQNPGGWGVGMKSHPPKQLNQNQPMYRAGKKISVFHQVKGKNTLARSQQQCFGSQPKQELKSKTIFSCSQLRLLRQKWRRGGRGEGATGKGGMEGGRKEMYFSSASV